MEHTSTSTSSTGQDVEALDWRPEASAPAVEGTISSRLELPSGGWVELKDAKEIRAKHRKRVVDSMSMDRMQAGTPGVAFDMLEGLMLMMVEKWSIPYLPDCARPLDNPSSVEELTIPDYDVLSGALEGARAVVFPTPASVDGSGKPGSPTRPGGA